MAKKVKKISTSKRSVSKKKKLRAATARPSKKVKKSIKPAAASKSKKPAKKKVNKKKAKAVVKKKAVAKKSASKAKRKSATKKPAKKTLNRASTSFSKKKTKKATPSSRKKAGELTTAKTTAKKEKAVAATKKVSGARKKTARLKLAIRVGMSIPKKTPASVRLANHRASTAATTEDPIQFQEQRKIPKTSLRAKELREFKKLLLHKRDQLTGDVNHMAGSSSKVAGAGGEEHSSAPVHMADLGTDNWEHEFTLGLIVNEQKRIREIDEALKRISNKTYGVCLATHKPISQARLHAKPWAKYCIDHARARDEGRA